MIYLYPDGTGTQLYPDRPRWRRELVARSADNGDGLVHSNINTAWVSMVYTERDKSWATVGVGHQWWLTTEVANLYHILDTIELHREYLFE